MGPFQNSHMTGSNVDEIGSNPAGSGPGALKNWRQFKLHHAPFVSQEEVIAHPELSPEQRACLLNMKSVHGDNFNLKPWLDVMIARNKDELVTPECWAEAARQFVAQNRG